jgi:hypothetical protein
MQQTMPPALRGNKRDQRVGNPAALRGGFRVMEFRLGTEQRVCGAGDVVVIPEGSEYEAWFREDTEVIDFFPPPRDDFLLGGKPAYLAKTEQLAPSSHDRGMFNLLRGERRDASVGQR